MADSQPPLRTLFADAFRQLEPGRPVPDVDVRYYPYAGLEHTIRVRSARVHVRLSDLFKSAPEGVHRALAFILVAKLLRRRTPQVHERIYRNYAFKPEVLRASDLSKRRRGRTKVSSARGRVYDLERMFARLNRRHFGGELSRPTLTWSQRRTRTLLGHHEKEDEIIVISKTLDSADVPAWFVEYILYHEMLHIKHPARVINGRRLRHTKAFRAEEQRFPFYEQAQEWLDRDALRRRTVRARAA